MNFGPHEVVDDDRALLLADAHDVVELSGDHPEGGLAERQPIMVGGVELGVVGAEHVEVVARLAELDGSESADGVDEQFR